VSIGLDALGDFVEDRRQDVSDSLRVRQQLFRCDAVRPGPPLTRDVIVTDRPGGHRGAAHRRGHVDHGQRFWHETILPAASTYIKKVAY
jgi:hypothetical protein